MGPPLPGTMGRRILGRRMGWRIRISLCKSYSSLKSGHSVALTDGFLCHSTAVAATAIPTYGFLLLLWLSQFRVTDSCLFVTVRWLGRRLGRVERRSMGSSSRGTMGWRRTLACKFVCLSCLCRTLRPHALMLCDGTALSVPSLLVSTVIKRIVSKQLRRIVSKQLRRGTGRRFDQESPRHRPPLHLPQFYSVQRRFHRVASDRSLPLSGLLLPSLQTMSAAAANPGTSPELWSCV
jgi:hypothetical protein